MLSVICPIYNEKQYIAGCVNSILAQDYPKDNLEVLFVDGMSGDGTREIVLNFAKRYSFIRLIDNEKRIVPVAMNIGIREAKGDVIMRLDAHAQYAPNYFSTLERALFELNADNVGAPCKTDVLNKTSKTLAIREVLCNRFGVGNSAFRLGVDKVQQVDTVPFGCWRREVFEKYGYYDERLVRNQDFELNKRISRGGGKIYIVPDTHSTYFARETFSKLAKQAYLNGKWNILTVYYTGKLRSLALRHFVPLIFVLSILLSLVLMPLYYPLAYISGLSLSLYLSCIILICFNLYRKKKINFFFLMYAFATLHFSYGWGSLMGYIRHYLPK